MDFSRVTRCGAPVNGGRSQEAGGGRRLGADVIVDVFVVVPGGGGGGGGGGGARRRHRRQQLLGDADAGQAGPRRRRFGAQRHRNDDAVAGAHPQALQTAVHIQNNNNNNQSSRHDRRRRRRRITSPDHHGGDTHEREAQFARAQHLGHVRLHVHVLRDEGKKMKKNLFQETVPLATRESCTAAPAGGGSCGRGRGGWTSRAGWRSRRRRRPSTAAAPGSPSADALRNTPGKPAKKKNSKKNSVQEDHPVKHGRRLRLGQR